MPQTISAVTTASFPFVSADVEIFNVVDLKVNPALNSPFLLSVAVSIKPEAVGAEKDNVESFVSTILAVPFVIVSTCP